MNCIRLANQNDVDEICNIYDWYVKHSAVTFDYTSPTVAYLTIMMSDIQKKYPFLVYECDKKVLAYAYAQAHRFKDAYQWNVELTIYVDKEHLGKQIGKALMDKLLQILTLQKFHNAYSCITIPNEASVALHKRFAFQIIGTFRKTGYKQSVWYDVIWMEKQLLPEQDIQPWVSICDIDQSELVKVIPE